MNSNLRALLSSDANPTVNPKPSEAEILHPPLETPRNPEPSNRTQSAHCRKDLGFSPCVEVESPVVRSQTPGKGRDKK